MRRKAIFSKDFTLVVIGQIISLFGNQILRYALPLYLLIQTGSSALFGTISAVAFIPMVLICPIGGIIADRVNKRNIMAILDFSTSFLTFLFFLLVGKVDVAPLVAATMILLYGIQGAYSPAVQASVPVLVDTEHIMQANSVVNLVNSLASLLGPVIGGILYSVVGLTPILYISIGCFFASAVMEIFIRIPFEKKETKGNIFVIGFNDYKESLGFIFKEQPVLWKVSLIFSSVNLLLTSLLLIGVPVLITQRLGFTANVANRYYGYAQGVIAAGSLLGGILSGVLSKKLNAKASPILLIGCSLSVLIVGIALQTISEPIGVYIVLMIGCGLMMALATMFSVQMMSYLQIMTPPNLTGKVISCVLCLCMCSNPLGQLIYGFVFEVIVSNIYLPFYVAALIMTGISVSTRSIFNGIEHLIEVGDKQ